MSAQTKPSLQEPITTADQLWNVLHSKLHMRTPRLAVCPHHQAPFEYLKHAFFEPTSDLVVWAPRGGGKTRLAAAATLLDLVQKPGCAVRILGGSLEQSLRMWEHLLPDLELLDRQLLSTQRGTAKRVRLTSGSNAAVLTQSQRAVRGLRVQKLRCDEVELFHPDIWEAAQFVTRSIEQQDEPGKTIAGSIEAISTFHSSHGLMSRIIDNARDNGTRIIHWCLLDVLERCPPERECASCPLWEECRGIAKTQCDGFYHIEDAIRTKRRVSIEAWETEMLCRRPSIRDSVFPHFDIEVHVCESVAMNQPKRSLALDFGFHNPFVCLWIADDGRRVHVFDEYVQPGRTIHEHIAQINSRGHGAIRALSCDPAGSSRSDQTADSNVRILSRAGFTVRKRRSSIVEGIELIRAALKPGYGEPTLFIHPGCTRLIKALQKLRYPAGGGELPVKDGEHDHLIDALRYHYVNRGRDTVDVKAY